MSTIAAAERLRQDAPRPTETAAAPTGLVAGVDTHADTHTAAVLDASGRLLAHATFPATAAGYSQLWTWLTGFGPVSRMGVEGTGAYGLGLTRHLRAVGVQVIEVDRSDRKARRFTGKADPLDAEAAARAVLAGVRTGVPKDRSSQVEALRVLRVARRSAVSQRADVIRQVKTLIVTAPDALRERLRHLTTGALIDTCAALRPDPVRAGQVEYATKVALRSLGRRYRSLSEEIKELEGLIHPLVEQVNPALLALPGVGPDSAGQLLVTAGANPERLRSEAALAMIAGVAPIPASSGKTHRHRLNRGGDRQANAAVHRIVITRLRRDPRTQAYLARRLTEGLSKAEIIRCLKRHVIREIYRALQNPGTASSSASPQTEPAAKAA
jgi:transposase